MISSIAERLRLICKHLVGKDVYLRPDVRSETIYYGSRFGGWALPRGFVKPESVVYSFGIGEDVSFDLALIETVGCLVHGFDPTPRSLEWVEEEVREPRFIVHPLALGPKDGTMELWLPRNPDHVSASCRHSSDTSGESFVAECRSLSSVMADLGHEHVDVIKMDVEGAEYEVIRSIVANGNLSCIGCLLVEFHHWKDAFDRKETLGIIELLRAKGFLIHWVSPRGHEVLFARRNVASS